MSKLSMRYHSMGLIICIMTPCYYVYSVSVSAVSCLMGLVPRGLQAIRQARAMGERCSEAVETATVSSTPTRTYPRTRPSDEHSSFPIQRGFTDALSPRCHRMWSELEANRMRLCGWVLNWLESMLCTTELGGRGPKRDWTLSRDSLAECRFWVPFAPRFFIKAE